MRCSENTTLAIMHTVWQRQYNSIVTALAEWNPCLDDEKLLSRKSLDEP